ncbi:bifunctional phosphoribosyl-AMP cyclohydrolase/phosphoribosyl-ATP diphosphatase HisIE [Melghirimyces profundicolus]|uniref:bifunctional phosphoribosyl-AMP cyclohydrolase/phosphoribosyl-ATP diphosphatase HisIE n=1 Tax=Melghirimyces profundicolus TaxID=1242148 RepID=UPI000D3C548A|nr:bifunctional phosphoribosyl-AMP cyclohydrolase/phosphoribosyl-ATP diphosphatase HisIE [Melghirimyces profundicolus]
MNPADVRFDRDGLIPAIVQDADSKEVLTLAYMNEESLRKTLETGETWFWSRSRLELWHKGATSGNTQEVISVQPDCDRDALLVRVRPRGPACHTGDYSCFREDGKESSPDRFAILNTLERVIAERDMTRPEKSYTTYLLEEGTDKILKKVGEEATEVVIAAKNRSSEELSWEASDLLFHLLVLLREQQLPLDRVLEELEKRHGGGK